MNRSNLLLERGSGIGTQSTNVTGARRNGMPKQEISLPEILVISSYPPRQCGIATYSQDLVGALNNKFHSSFLLTICALENESEKHVYPAEVKYILNTDEPESFHQLSATINASPHIGIVILQHEFGFYSQKENEIRFFLASLKKPVVIVFHTVLPSPHLRLKEELQGLTNLAAAVIVMTNASKNILRSDYDIPSTLISVIPHGTHLVTHTDKALLKTKYGLEGRKVLSTFGLLSSGKSIETTLRALPAIARQYPDVLFLIIGKTHPSVVKHQGEEYRTSLEKIIDRFQLNQHVKFINEFLPLPQLLDYLQLTDIYLFTSKDPNQAVSGTFSYAISCGCPVISTPIPHAVEVLQQDGGVIVDFENEEQLSEATIGLLSDKSKRDAISSNGLHMMASTAWENAAIAHALLIQQLSATPISLNYTIPEINMGHIKKMTTDFGIIQFSKINQPDILSGYTLDDNARALIAMCQHYELTKDRADLKYISIYFKFIQYCLQPEGHFLNYVKAQLSFTDQNTRENLADANGRAIWALGYLLSLENILPLELVTEAADVMSVALLTVEKIHSTRAMAFVIKGLYYRSSKNRNEGDAFIIAGLANRLVQMYRHESTADWQWFESYLTYANSILPEAMLCAWLATGNTVYKNVAKSTFEFLLSKIFDDQQIKVISNRSWLHHGDESARVMTGGEQPIDVAYTILALDRFLDVFDDAEYYDKMIIAFNWFLGNNHLHQIIYNPCTGGCYDGLEVNNVNLNQGAESTVSCLMARLTIERRINKTIPVELQRKEHSERAGSYVVSV